MEFRVISQEKGAYKIAEEKKFKEIAKINRRRK